MKFRPLRTASEEAEELKVCSREISSLDERHLAVGRRDSVEPRIKEEPRGTDEVIMNGEARRTDELVHSGSHQRRTDEPRQPNLSAGSPTVLFSRSTTQEMAESFNPYGLVAGRWYCEELDCRDQHGNRFTSFASKASLKRHKFTKHGLRRTGYVVCGVDGCRRKRKGTVYTVFDLRLHHVRFHGIKLPE